MSEREMARDTAEEGNGAVQRGAGQPGAVQPGRVRPEAARALHEEEMPRVVVTRREAVAFGLFVLTVVGFLYFVLPKLAGVGTTLHHLENGNGWWIAIGVVLELLSFAGYVVLFRAVFVGRRAHPPRAPRRPGPIGWNESYRSRWPAWPPRACSRPPGPGGSH
ncbi:MAG TPA: hypothetical protein VJ996_00265 [Solirubrobacteraceae bacterium]|nr:hypothetical protein [Solirubrobacteraceae bacterium]